MGTRCSRKRYGLGIVAAVGLLCLGVFLFWPKTDEPDEPAQRSFDGGSEDLPRTLVVPTLDTDIPPRHNAIWCSSFQLAWNRLKADVAGGPIQLRNAEATANRLNQAPQSDSDLDPRGFYAAAGFVGDGILPTIQAEMGKKFPHVPVSLPDSPPNGAVAYGYLKARVKFRTPFFDNDESFLFTDSTGKQVPVKSFGIRKKDDYAYEKLRQQVQVLYCSGDVFWKEREGGEYIVDPCKYSQPYQVILAAIRRKATLAEAVAGVNDRITNTPAEVPASLCNPRDTLLIPAMHWRVHHRFRELEGKDKQFQNDALAGRYLDTALQTIEFRLDRSGAELASESKVYVKPGATYFHFNRPFLVILKKRGAEQPFFVMWVDNAELLDK